MGGAEFLRSLNYRTVLNCLLRNNFDILTGVITFAAT